MIPSGQTDQRSLSGTVLQPSGAALAGVTVTAGNPSKAVTDINGNFIILNPPAGTISVTFDGTTASVAGADFVVLRLLVPVNETGPTVLRPITLPDLNDPATAAATVPVDTDGVTTQAFTATGASGDIQLSGPPGTSITIGGQPASGSVGFTVTPVAPGAIPVALPGADALDGASFVTIRPAGANFDTGTGQGLNVRLPNDRDFPVGAAVDIWSFDYDVGVWENRSQETGNQGGVVDLGGGVAAIEADGVITEGGTHAAVLAVAPACGTTVRGRVVDQGGNPIPNTSLATSLGQLGVSGTDGTFSVPNVPAYVVADLPACTRIGFVVEFRTPVFFGAVPRSVNVAAGSVVSGGITNLGDVTITVPATGDLAGIVVDSGAPPPGGYMVDISGPTTRTVSTTDTGTFFATGLIPGAYTASVTFAGASGPTARSFSIATNRVTTLEIRRSEGTGPGPVTVIVLYQEDVTEIVSAVPASGARVLLIGTDSGSAGGLTGTTDDEGRVTFASVVGPFTVTAQADVTLATGPATARLAASLIDFDPPADMIGLTLYGAAPSGASPPVTPATLSGTVSNLPDPGPGETFEVAVRGGSGPGTFEAQAPVIGGFYSAPVPLNQIFAVAFVHAGPNGTRNVILDFDVGPATSSGQTITRNFDFNSSARIPVESSVSVTYQNTLPSPDFVDARLTFQHPTRGDGELSFAVAAANGLPTMIALPDAAAANLSGLVPVFSAYQDELRVEGAIEMRSSLYLDSTPSSLTITFGDVPAIQSPAVGAVLTKEAAAMLDVAFTVGTSNLPQGVNLVTIRSADTGLPVDYTEWWIFVPTSTTSFTLPPTVLPMFGDDGAYELKVEANRWSPASAAFPDIFDIFDEHYGDNLRTLFNSFEEERVYSLARMFSTSP